MSSTMRLSKLLDQTQCALAVISEYRLNDNITCINYLNSVNENYLSFVKVDTDVKLPTYQHFVGKGGVGIIFKRSLQYSIKEIPCCNSNRIVGVVLTYNNGEVLYILVYISLLIVM